MTLAGAIDEALRATGRAEAAGMKEANGDAAGPLLAELRERLGAIRTDAAAGRAVDRDRLRVLIRWVAGWAPADDITLLAALGSIARAAELRPPPRGDAS